MDLVLKTAGLKFHEMANNRGAWWFGNDLPDSRQSFRWAETKGSRVLRGYSEKRKLHLHFGVSAFYRGGPIRHYRIKTRLLFSEDGTTILPGKRMHRVRRSFAKGGGMPGAGHALGIDLLAVGRRISILRDPDGINRRLDDGERRGRAHVHGCFSARQCGSIGISTQIKQLEDLYGFQIFSRDRDGVSLTPYGDVLLACARDLLQVRADVIDMLMALRTGEITPPGATQS